MTARCAAGFVVVASALTMAAGATARQEADDADEGSTSDQLDAIRRASLVIGAEVRGPGGEDRIARVFDLVLDGSGRIRYVLVSPRGAVGDDSELVPVPARFATLTRFDEDSWFLLLQAEKALLESAPTLGADEVAQLREPERRAAIAAHFESDPGEAPVGHREVSDGRFDRALVLLGCAVIGADREAVARVEEVLIDDEHLASYVVLRPEGDAGRLVPVPFSALTIDSGPPGEPVVARIAKDRAGLESAPELAGDWLRMLNVSFIEAVNNVHAPQVEGRKP